MLRLVRIHLLAAVAVAVSAAPAAPLQAVLTRMDQAAASFRGVSGQLERITHTAVIQDTQEERGSFHMKKVGNDLRMLISFTEPSEKMVAFLGKKAQIYYPKVKTVQEYDLGKHRSLVDQFLLLGFGSSGKELAKSYQVAFGGKEEIGGVAAARLELTPKSAQVSEHVKKAELWISEETGFPVQQKFHQGGGDYMLMRYKNVKVEPNLSNAAVELQLPPGVKFEYPQK